MIRTLLLVCGFYNLVFAGFHIMFWKFFKWKEDLQKNSAGNRAIMQILNIRLIYIFLLIGFIYLLLPEQLIETSLGRVLQIGILGFWVGRTIEQFIFLRIKSKMVNILTIVFIAGVILHLLPILLH
ncbi:MAG TPA: hypothetical protein VHO72_15085 [Bacteroidales bacterium]|nr:hypothetical protein [Bacteroidales bacterium]